MRAILTIVCLGLCTCAFAADSGQSKADANAVEGIWEIVSAEMGGKAMPVEAFQGGRLKLKAGAYSFLNDVGEYKTFSVEGRSAMDVVGTKGPNMGKTIPAIYETGENRLTICYDLACQQRPKAFKTEKGSRQFLVTYRKSTE